MIIYHIITYYMITLYNYIIYDYDAYYDIYPHTNHVFHHTIIIYHMPSKSY